MTGIQAPVATAAQSSYRARRWSSRASTGGLRKAREDAHDAPGAADFYYGEMEMRRLAAREDLLGTKGWGARILHLGSVALLELYRLVGGYGVRPLRPFLIFVAMVFAAAIAIDSKDLIHHLVVTPDGKHHLYQSSFQEALVFVLRSALLLIPVIASRPRRPANRCRLPLASSVRF